VHIEDPVHHLAIAETRLGPVIPVFETRRTADRLAIVRDRVPASCRLSDHPLVVGLAGQLRDADLNAEADGLAIFARFARLGHVDATPQVGWFTIVPRPRTFDNARAEAARDLEREA